MNNIVGRLWYEAPAADLRKGTSTLKVGRVYDCDGQGDKPCTVIWFEFNQPKDEIEKMVRLLRRDETLTNDELEMIHPYHFKDVYVTRESKESLAGKYQPLEAADAAFKQLNYLSAWEGDVYSLIRAGENLEEALAQYDMAITRPHWTQVQAQQDLEKAEKAWAEEQARFIRYWKDKVPFEKDEVFKELVIENIIRQPETIKY